MGIDPQPQGPVTAVSVLDKASLFQTQAEAIHAGRSERQEIERIAHRRSELSTALQALDRALTITRGVAALEGIAPFDKAIDDGYEKFRRKFTQGNSSNATFKAALTKVQGAAAQREAMAKQAWEAWVGARLDALPSNRDALLSSDERKDVRERRALLAKIRTALPTPSDIRAFATTYELLLDTLQQQPELPNELIDILDRLSARSPLMLSDLSDDDIALLRSTPVAEQIQLRRRDA
ncbi:hypothetical protein [Micromonospora rubida]|uniref:hypothetical protein n=1 Tax=Micromonospora rubida TaxID=2697657 RepID=UPI0013788D82|nr:hypothetical protein [Micromonospora rubida]NBE85423.1 hypothetical protein [Micromonospora rubida]